MTNSSSSPGSFASQPLADFQAEQAAAPKAPAPAPSATPPQPVVDINFTDLPEESYPDFSFPLATTPGIVYTLGIDDDAILFEILEMTRQESPNTIIEFTLTETFRRAVDQDGNEVEDGLKMLADAIDPHRRGPKERRKYLMEIVLAAIDRWSEELTDTSMRPVSRAQRRQRRR